MKNVILIKHPKNWGLSEEKVIVEAENALEFYGFKNDTELSIIFVGRKRAKKLNIKYRKMNYIPQVLGFPMFKDKDKDGYIRLGDVVICTEKLKYEALYQKNGIDEILKEWIRHGVENLLK